MARAKSRVAAIASFEPFFDVPGNVEWSLVENQVGSKLDTQSKNEIAECAIEFSASYDMQFQAPDLQSFSELRDTLHRICDETVEFERKAFEWVHPHDRDEANMKFVNAYNTLAIAYGDDFSVSEALKCMADSARVLLTCFDTEPPFSVAGSAREPLTAALSSYIGEALKGSEAQGARGNTAWSGMSFEFSRWGVSIGPQSGQFRKFTNAVLGKHFAVGPKEISASRLKQAFELMRSDIREQHPHFSKLSKKI